MFQTREPRDLANLTPGERKALALFFSRMSERFAESRQTFSLWCAAMARHLEGWMGGAELLEKLYEGDEGAPPDRYLAAFQASAPESSRGRRVG